MIVAYIAATLVQLDSVQTGTLVIDAKRGRILPPQMAKYAHQRINAEGWAIYPGLINAHEHLQLNHFPRSRPREIYTNASQWAADMGALLDREPYVNLRQVPPEIAHWVGGLKNLFSGVTTVVHHDPWRRFLGGRGFPVSVLRPYGWAHSLYLSPPQELQKKYQRSPYPFMLHLAEGTDEAAAAELNQLAALGCLSAKTLLIHGVGLRAEEQAWAIEKSGGLIWCPSTNHYLLGQTADVKAWYAAGKLALGSDSRLTADGDLLDELKAALADAQLSPKALFDLVTRAGVRLFKLGDRGDLLPNMHADLIALALPANISNLASDISSDTKTLADYHAHLIHVQRKDIQWVMRGGQIIWRQDEQRPNCFLDGVGYRWLGARRPFKRAAPYVAGLLLDA